MTSLWQAPAIAVVITWLTAPPGSLGQAAKQEALRRTMVAKAVVSISLYDWPAAVSGESAAAAAPNLPAAAATAPPVPSSTVGVTTATAGPLPAAGDEPKRDEAWWRTRMAAARAALARDQTLADAMQSHINSLRTDVASRDDPAQQAALRQRLTSALTELDRLTQQIAADRQAIAVVEDDARRLGVPAGWIRDDGRVSASGRSP
ncbi:MAG TPA: hypothetical protein VES67_12050 [Vicinamibacterales bacterium]|nr:hypothetical protein [Vicinamibacterales bacterium]